MQCHLHRSRQLLRGTYDKQQEQIMLIDLRRSVLGDFMDPTLNKVLNTKSEHRVDMSRQGDV